MHWAFIHTNQRVTPIHMGTKAIKGGQSNFSSLFGQIVEYCAKSFSG